MFCRCTNSAKCRICSATAYRVLPIRRNALRVMAFARLSLSLSQEYLHILLINSPLSKSVNKIVGCGRVCHFWFPVGAVESVCSPFFLEWLWVPHRFVDRECPGFLCRVVKTVWACSWLFSSHTMPNWMQEALFTHPVHFYSLHAGTHFHSRCFNTTVWLLTRNECGERREC
jgi:hypothetical protein